MNRYAVNTPAIQSGTLPREKASRIATNGTAIKA